MHINDILKVATERKASDVHLKVGAHPLIRVDGQLVPLVEFKRLMQEDTIAMGFSIMSTQQKEKFKQYLEIDIAYSVPGLGRFRCNIFQQRGSVGLVLRLIPARILATRELLLPPVLDRIAEEDRGLVLVTGTTGSGKSTTLAAMIDHINATRNCHIVTIEDPIEFLHRDKKAIINQREVEVDTRAFSVASRVCRVENTRWPVSAASRAVSMVSKSRISPTRMTSGSWRRIDRSALANVSPAFGLTCTWLMPANWYSMGSSTVTMLTSGLWCQASSA